MPGDVVAVHEIKEVVLRIAFQSRHAETLVFGDKILRTGMDIGEIASTAAGNADLFGGLCRMIGNHHGSTALAGFNCTHQAGCTGTNDQNIDFFHVNQTSLFSTGWPALYVEIGWLSALSGATLLCGFVVG